MSPAKEPSGSEALYTARGKHIRDTVSTIEEARKLLSSLLDGSVIYNSAPNRKGWIPVEVALTSLSRRESVRRWFSWRILRRAKQFQFVEINDEMAARLRLLRWENGKIELTSAEVRYG